MAIHRRTSRYPTLNKGWVRVEMTMKVAMMKRLWWFLAVAFLALGAGAVRADEEAPDAFVKRLSNELLEVVKSDKTLRNGDLNKIIAVVDARIMPSVNFQRIDRKSVV